MIKSVNDTHRLMYRNATIRALDLSDRTTPIPFFNITDQELPSEDIGYEVHTDAAGYLYYGVNSRPIQCLAVNKSAIIQVDVTGNNSRDIEWVLRIEDTDEYVRVEDLHKVFYADGTLAWDPTLGDWHMPDYALKTDIGRGEWAEGEMIVTEDTPEILTIDKWTHVITFRNGHADKYTIPYTQGRYAQTIRILNISNTDVVVVTQHMIGDHIYNTRVTIGAGHQSEATYTDHVGWYMDEPVVPSEVVNTDYVITEVSALGLATIDLDVNQDIKRVIFRPTTVPALGIIEFRASGTAGDMPVLEIVNESESPVQTWWHYQTSPGVYTPALNIETVPARSTLTIAPNACDGSRSQAITYNETTIKNDNIHVLKTPTYWYGTININTSLYGVWLPVMLFPTKGVSLPGDESHRIEVNANGVSVLALDVTPNDLKGTSTHDPVYIGDDVLLISVEIRLSKVVINGTEQIVVDRKPVGGQIQ